MKPLVAVVFTASLLAAGPASASLTQRMGKAPTSCNEASAQASRSTYDSLRLTMVTTGATPSRSIMWQGYARFQRELAHTYSMARAYLKARCPLH
jgi:hypothetical protein